MTKTKPNSGPAPIPELYDKRLFSTAKIRRGLSLADLSKETGLSINTVKDIIDGRSNNLKNIYLLCEYYGLYWPELFAINPGDGGPAYYSGGHYGNRIK